MDLFDTPATWQHWCFAILALAMLMIDEVDVREQRIPNVMVLLLLCAGVFLNTTGPANSQQGPFSPFPGALGAAQSLLGVLVGLALFLPLYLWRAMGAGDVKLLAALGAFAGPLEIISLALIILIAGGLLAVARMLWRRNSRLVLANVMLVLGGGAAGGFDLARQSADRMPYALAFSAGLLLYGCWRSIGGAPFIVF